MGELLFCHEPLAAMPFYIEEIGMNIYSMEELCYYIAGNTYLLDKSFMSEELCNWVEHQMGLYKLVEQLRNQHRLSEFVRTILEYTGYYSQKEIEDIVLVLRNMEEKSDFECSKMRADRLLEKGKYISSIYEYKRLLESGEAKAVNDVLTGNIWHNLGTANARLFLFEEAIRCYDEAYRRNGSKESLKSCLMCYRCLHDEAGFIKKAMENQMDEMGMQEIRNELSLISRNETTVAFEEKIEEIARQNEAGQRAEAKKAVSDIIFRWKEEYRKSCRM